MTQHTYGWEAITPNRRPRNVKAEAEQAVWKVQNQIIDWDWTCLQARIYCESAVRISIGHTQF